MSNFVPGIYCEIPLREFYRKDIARKCSWRLNAILGIHTEMLEGKVLDKYIANAIEDAIRTSWTQRNAVLYKDEKIDLKDYYGYAIYYNGVLTDNYGGTKFSGNQLFSMFAIQYEPICSTGWVVVIGNSHPLAARFDASGQYEEFPHFKGYNKKVLIQMVQGVAKRIRAKLYRTSSEIHYGYILNSVIHNTVGKRLQLS